MTDFLTTEQQEMFDTVKGLNTAISEITRKMPESSCPKLKSDLRDIADLSQSLHIISRMLNHSVNN